MLTAARPLPLVVVGLDVTAETAKGGASALYLAKTSAGKPAPSGVGRNTPDWRR